MGLIIDASARPLHLPGAAASQARLPAAPRVLRRLAAAACGLLALAAQAQIVDDLEYRRDGVNAVLAIRFVTPVQYQRSVVARSGDQVTIFYRVLPTRQTLELVTTERRLPGRQVGSAGASLPTATVTDDAAPGSDSERRVVVRLSTPVRQSVRAGRGGSSIEVVLEGRGMLLTAPVPESELPATATAGFRVTLESSEQAGNYLSSPVPASLQDVNVFTTRRVEGGRTLHETHLGPFATRAEAESALAAVRRRFPAAAVTTAGASRVAAAVVAPARRGHRDAGRHLGSCGRGRAGTGTGRSRAVGRTEHRTHRGRR